MVKDIYFPYLDHPQEIQAGKLVFLAVDANEPPGKSLKACRFKQVLLTYFDPQVEAAIGERRITQAVVYRRRQALLRMANEAKAQGAYLTAEDFAYKLFNCGMRTISRDLQHFREQNIIVPLRGQQKDMGRGLTHRAQVVEAYLNHKSYSEIERQYQHSLESIDNYIQTFLRVVFLKGKGHSDKEIAFLLKSSTCLVRQHLELYHKLKHQTRSTRIGSGNCLLLLSRSKKTDPSRKGGNHETRKNQSHLETPTGKKFSNLSQQFDRPGISPLWRSQNHRDVYQ
jgi:hypothetical protein